jgi:hypothetical protein
MTLWFLPLALGVGLAGTATCLKSMGLNQKDRSWVVLLVLAWLPLACCVLSRFILQD